MPLPDDSRIMINRKKLRAVCTWHTFPRKYVTGIRSKNMQTNKDGNEALCHPYTKTLVNRKEVNEGAIQKGKRMWIDNI